MPRKFLFLVLFLAVVFNSFSQGVGVPSKKWGIGFGNLPVFNGLRFNFRDKNVEKVSGINVTIWQPKDEDDQTGTVNGISIGLPMAMGTENRNGIGVGLLGVGAKNNLSGINFGGFGIGAGGDVKGLNIGGLGIGSGGNLVGISVGGLGVGSGGDITGINLGGLGVGAGSKLKGFSFGTLGVGAGESISGITIGGLGVGAGENLAGLTIGGLGVGGGKTVSGITFGGLGVGAGTELKGIAISVLAVGSPKVSALVIAPIAGSQNMRGLILAPAYMKVGYTSKNTNDDGEIEEDIEGTFKGVSVSAFNHIKGSQKGIAFGVVNYTYKIKGVQLGLINIVKENPKGLRVLPLFNTHFGKKGASAE
jgi:hypothetical protein